MQKRKSRRKVVHKVVVEVREDRDVRTKGKLPHEEVVTRANESKVTRSDGRRCHEVMKPVRYFVSVLVVSRVDDRISPVDQENDNERFATRDF